MSFGSVVIVIISFLVALLLSILPLPVWLTLIQPRWVVLVVIYWIIALPHRFSLGVAWILGILLDVLYGTVLGEHALALSVVAFIAQRLHRQIRMFPAMQQAFSIFLLIIVYEGLLLWIQGMLGQLGSNARWFWASGLTSMLFWPWVHNLLHTCQRRFRVY